MPAQIHGHEVMAMMTASPLLYTRASLKAAIAAKFGAASAATPAPLKIWIPMGLTTFLPPGANSVRTSPASQAIPPKSVLPEAR